MLISGLDFGLIITISYLLGLGSGVSIICKYRNNILIDNQNNNQNTISNVVPQVTASPIIASAPPPHTINKITLE